MSSLKNLNIVLVRAQNPVNIGQAARAMKNFGVSKLNLVACVPHQVREAFTPGWKGKKILDSAACHSNLGDVLSGSTLSVGFTTRAGKRRGEPRFFSEVTAQVAEVIRDREAHFVFGNEKNGLSNEELDACHVITRIPASLEYSSLNLSHAVTIALFSVYSRTQEARAQFKKPQKYYPRQEQFDSLMESFGKLLALLDYKKDLLARVHDDLKQFFRRSGLDRRELNLFQALLSRVNKIRYLIPDLKGMK